MLTPAPKLFFAIFFLLLSTILGGQVLDGTRICIDAGHGGHTSNDRQIFLPYGKVYWESEGDFQTATHLKEILESLGATVKLTRTNNADASDISLSERSAIANTFGSDYFHSIHTNGGGGNYSLVLYKEINNNPYFPEAKEMGDIMAPYLEDLMKTVQHYNRGDYSFLGYNLGVLNYANMPSTLSESSFHDLPEEGLRLKNSAYLKNYAWAIAKSFCAYFEVGGFPTGRVGGVITDITSGVVVNDVNVVCEPVNTIYTGDDNYNGFYAIGELNPGDYTLILNRAGYLENTVDIRVQANKYLDLDLKIQYYNNGFPNVDFYVLGLPAGAGELVTFNAEKSTDDGTIDVFAWDFGDGTPLDTGMIIYHRFDVDGSYTVSMTATDDEGNQSDISKTINIITSAPDAPLLLSVEPANDNRGVKIRWKKNTESNISKYTIYYSNYWNFSDTTKLAELDAESTSYTLDSFGLSGIPYYFWVTAGNIGNRESDQGDTYAFVRDENDEMQNLLLVDGFNRKSSYTGVRHSFVAKYLTGVQSSGEYRISTCSNNAIISNAVSLQDYAIVFWFLGDESTVDETFSTTEQSKLKSYLKNGGKLFVTGSEIGWDLSHKGSVQDKAFYNQYLKATYQADGGAGRSPARGLNVTDFEGVILNFGQSYPEDYPDEIGTFGGSTKIMKYKNNANCGIKYSGTFGSGTTKTALVNIGFPLESVANQSEINVFIQRVLAFFNTIPTGTFDDDYSENSFVVFPVPVQNIASLHYDIKRNTNALIEIFDTGGSRVFSKYEALSEGGSVVDLFIAHLASGLYIVRVSAENERHLIKIIKP